MSVQPYSKGLAGVIADETSICLVDGEKGELYYRGNAITEIAQSKSFDETCYLLLYGQFPEAGQLADYRRQVAEQSELPEFAKSIIRALPAEQHPMEVLLCVIPALGKRLPADIETERISIDGEKRTMVSEQDVHRTELLGILAKIPTIIAYFHRQRQGLDWVTPDPELDLLTNFLTMFRGEQPSQREIDVFSICEILQMEHGFNASTFTSRVVASTLAPMHASLSAAVGALYGKLHGGADEAAFLMARDEIGAPDKAEAFLDQLLSEGGKVMGLGHRVYRTMDPRAKILKSLAKELIEEKGGEKQVVLNTLLQIESVMADRMAAKGKEIHPNVEFFKGPVFNALDIPPDHFTAMFVIARSFGWGAHILELWQDHRIYRPKAKYVGPVA